MSLEHLVLSANLITVTLERNRYHSQTTVCGSCPVQESQGAGNWGAEVGHQQRKVAGLPRNMKHGSTRTVPSKTLDPECFSGRTETQSWVPQSWSVGMGESGEAH